ncbi:50S ribosomal protein L30 [Alicyclobacillus macrosporangiidus]|uniref:50S ribosomal protein L30 n=1 Tax=Alicyclobacillus macrosporangiidus TaxID=392015 RepID=UPI0004984F8C|nr:50S ribosomal protein L30 [Alicyclobacillus macrosporangiidus]MCL6597454.1 50S ribosomal protein L30 [Alicyclobacillus macrosporangiidus]
MAQKLAITLVHSPVGRPEKQRRTAVALGLRKMHQTVVHEDTPVIRGMVDRIKHLVDVKVVDGE